MRIQTIALVSLLTSCRFVAQESRASDAASAGALVQPATLIVDHSLPKQTLTAEILAARRYDTFWDNGDEALARAASFMRKDDIARFAASSSLTLREGETI